jgi:YbbR domain-containing protein
MKKLLLENIGMKISAVILAVILWFFVTSRGQSEVSMEIPVGYKNIPAGLESVKQSVKSISVNIKGQERLLRNLKSANVRVYIDLNKAKKGRGTYYISKNDVILPRTMTVIGINPSSVEIVLEETITKTVPVKPVIVGSPKKGFIVGSVEVTPMDVTIEGVKAEVNMTKILMTEPVDISDIDKSSVFDTRLDMAGKNIRADIQEVSVKVNIK